MSDLTRLVSTKSPKMLREVLCRIQSGQTNFGDKEVIADFIKQIDKMRPLGPDGKHGQRHTALCGCSDKGPPWSWDR